ncbi:hypothetical protein P9173_09775 [Bacillus safensis]|uniref:hypothetical protein n=1 Tax=Bacillus safensis TaxID=561879 RepID=UPI0022827F0F|nr:hypothetical protein [Bacillus safensis]MCY7542411.1 hypothetical protein [Bacillus safensis]MCY7552256.1 hypothetical protein [Bacillus safensis]MCY7644717.1 hypothetical protein [Bacillus safensis]MCY7655968.1 hypothetical protein [Bacillus safensis]MEC3710443.1 hypothetical protein [Bacillus safensis]
MKLGNVKILDVKEGEFKKIEYEGSEYERIDDYAIKGDLIFIQHETDKGFYKVENNKHIAWVCFTDSFKRKVCCLHTDCTVFRKKHTRLKVSDYAKVIDCVREWKVDQGDIVKVLFDDKKYRPFECEVQNGEFVGETVWMHESELVLATEAEVAAAKEAEAKRSIEAKWAKIGRKVDEYKVGDIVAYDDVEWHMNGGIGEVVAVTVEDNDTLVSSVDYQGKRIRFVSAPGKLTLITPYEARFDIN